MPGYSHGHQSKSELFKPTLSIGKPALGAKPQRRGSSRAAGSGSSLSLSRGATGHRCRCLCPLQHRLARLQERRVLPHGPTEGGSHAHKRNESSAPLEVDAAQRGAAAQPPTAPKPPYQRAPQVLLPETSHPQLSHQEKGREEWLLCSCSAEPLPAPVSVCHVQQQPLHPTGWHWPDPG